ncbi:MAG TPA: signal peptidase I [Gammaproteobacteria bacterium]|nr:signal peptidase I [Gammaproteobacteria bacterium]
MTTMLKRLIAENRGFLLFIVLLIAFRSSIADWNVVPTGSMKPTIQIGDRILVNKSAYDYKIPFTNISLFHKSDPRRGDIVVFNSEKAGKKLVKRLIGLPGDTLAMVDNQLLLNGHTLNYEKLSSTQNQIIALEQLGKREHLVRFDPERPSPLRNFAPITIPDGYFLMLGDNRDNSADSRVIGLVPQREIAGKATRVIVSLDKHHYYLPRSERFLKALQ